eukprot:TRINITY_DN2809_c0_g1_i2.p1 TRINITY_DN2809_c0_g1~~TRINITY_DN2809_c0_g1_i2.p1  ORF type:complete len:653 (+),score=199.48 TRINITY_DN2809_c0_g1_i2:43-1959(+)
MESTEESEKIAKLKTDLESARSEAKTFEAQMMKAAQYGKELLESNMKLERDMEKEKQEKYALSLRLQAKESTVTSLNLELDTLRESLKNEEAKIEKLRETEESMSRDREEQLKLRLSETENELDTCRTNETRLKETIEELERKLESFANIKETSLGESFISESLKQENDQLVQEKQSLESELAKVKSLADEYESQIRNLNRDLESKQEELENVQSEIVGYTKTIDSLKEEIEDKKVELSIMSDQMGASKDEGEKGNSLFSEVEDRRQVVEVQLSTMKEKYNTMKETYDAKILELQRVKMHNSQLLSLAGGSRHGTDHVARLEELLQLEKTKNRELLEKFDKLGQGDQIQPHVVGEKPSSQEDGKAKENGEGGSEDVSLMEVNDSSDVESGSDHVQSKQYKYMAHMLENANKKQEELQSEVRKLVREGVEQSDKHQDTLRQLLNTEQQVKKLQSENYALKIKMEDLANKGESSGSKKEPKKRRIVEKIAFKTEEDSKENSQPSSTDEVPFAIRESSAKPALNLKMKVKEPLAANIENDTENKDRESDGVSKKKTIRLLDEVEEISCDGSKMQKPVKEDIQDEPGTQPEMGPGSTCEGQPASRSKTTTSQQPPEQRKKGGGKKHTADVKKAEVAEECKQQ